MKEKSLKNRINEVKTPYNPEAWKQMEQHLKETQPSAKYSILKHLNVILSIVGISGVALLLWITLDTTNEYTDTGISETEIIGDLSTSSIDKQSVSIGTKPHSSISGNTAEAKTPGQNKNNSIDATNPEVTKTATPERSTAPSSNTKASKDINGVVSNHEKKANGSAKMKGSTTKSAIDHRSSPSLTQTSDSDPNRNQSSSKSRESGNGDESPKNPAALEGTSFQYQQQREVHSSIGLKKTSGHQRAIEKQEGIIQLQHEYPGLRTLNTIDLMPLSVTKKREIDFGNLPDISEIKKQRSRPPFLLYLGFGAANYTSFNFNGYRIGAGAIFDLSRHFSAEASVSYFSAKPSVQPEEESDFSRQTDLSLSLNWNIVKWRRHTLSAIAGGGVSFAKAQKYYTSGVFDKSGVGFHFRLGGRYDIRLYDRIGLYVILYASHYIETIRGASMGISWRM